MATVSQEFDLETLIADTEAEILRLVGDHDDSTAGAYEMIRYHLGLDGSGAPSGKRMRPLLGLLAYASIAGDHAAALPGAAAVELGHNFSLVHDDIEDGDRERRHRPTLWALHGVAQAINAGDMLFSLSRVALHRLSDLGFSDAKVLRLMRLYDETCVALCEGQYIDIATSESDEVMSVELYFDMIGRKTAALIAASIQAGALLATAGIPAERRPARDLGRRAGDRQGADRHRPPQEDAAGHLRLRARRAGGSRAPRRALPQGRTDGRRRHRDHLDPRSERRPRLHPDRGSPPPRRGARRAGRRRRGRRTRPGEARTDHRVGDHRVGRLSGRASGRRPRPGSGRRSRRGGEPREPCRRVVRRSIRP
jgi:hypothetical protein